MANGAYTSQPHQTLPGYTVAHLRQLRDARIGRNNSYTAAVVALYQAGWGIPALAAAVGPSATAVARRVFRGIEAGHTVPPFAFAIPRPDRHALNHPRFDPLPDLPADLSRQIRRAFLKGQYRRGNMAADDPRVQAALDYDTLLAKLIANGVRPAQIARAAQTSDSCIAQRLGRIGTHRHHI